MTTTAHTSAHGLLRHAVRRGVPAATVAQWLGVDAPALDRPGRLPAARVLAAWVRLRNELSDAAVAARAAREWSLADYGLFGFHIAAAPTLGDALRAAAASSRLITERGSWRLVEDGELARCIWSWTGPHTPDHALSNEVMVSALVRGVRELTGAPPLRVQLSHRAPPARSDHDALLECSVRFAQPETAVVFPRALLSVVPRSANPALYRFLGGLAARELESLAPPGVRERAAHLLMQRLRSDAVVPALAEVARNLGMSERTLRRRLADERVSFRDLRNTAQLERAADLLGSDASLSEIALACGFADASAFGRAWRRRRGQAPSNSRAAARHAAAATRDPSAPRGDSK